MAIFITAAEFMEGFYPPIKNERGYFLLQDSTKIKGTLIKSSLFFFDLRRAAPVKDYQMPAREQGLADHISV
jgi:hypothetical protein